MKVLLTEAIGTFFLVLTIGLCVVGQAPLAPLFIGSSLMIMVYMGGHVSGAHYNPAVTLAVWMRGKLPSRQVVPYWLAQLVGAILAALVVRLVTGNGFAPLPNPAATVLDALLIEILFTFALALVVLNVATATGTAGNSFYGLAIGFTIVVGAAAGGGISGGAFNPAVGIGPTLVNALSGGSLSSLWLYIVGPLAGGALAALVFRIQNPQDIAPAG
jgi:aquaporin Z